MRSAEQDRRSDRPDGDRPTMADVSHANPRTGDTLGDVFRRGPAVADGGAAERDHAATQDSDGDETMGDVDHTPPNEDVNDVWARGADSPGNGESGGTDDESASADGGDEV